MISFTGKKILVICPSFFDYATRMIRELEGRGADVTYWDERPHKDGLTKALIRSQNKHYKKYLDRYYEKKINGCDIDFDYIVCIVCETESEHSLQLLCGKYTRAKKILYLWDSVKNKPTVLDKFKYFDSWFSFDQGDIKNYPQLKYAYWGYTSDFTPQIKDQYKYDVCFLGTAHSIRPFVLSKMKEECEKYGLKYYFYIYQANIFLYLYNKIRNKNFKYLSLKDIHFKTVSQKEMLELYDEAKVILDISSVNQSGMTTRVGEMVGLHKKVLTNNLADRTLLKKYPENFYLYDSADPKIDIRFFNTDYVKMDESDDHEYSFDNFLQIIFGE